MKNLTKNRLWFSVLSLLVIASVLLAACTTATPTPAGPTPTPKGPPLKIGAVQTVLFGLGELEADARAAQKLAIEDATGGTGEILGRKIEFIYRDDQGNPELGLSKARELVEEVGVEFLFGTFISSVSRAISGYALEKKILFLIHGSQAPSLTAEGGHRYVVRTTYDGSIIGRAFSNYAAQQGWKRLYLTSPDYEYGQSMMNVEEQLIKELVPGAQILGKDLVPWGEPDFRPWLTKWLATNPDAMLTGIWGDDLIALVKQAAPLGFFDRMEVAAEWGAIAGTQRALGAELPDGIITGQTNYFLASDSAANTAFIQRMREATGMFPPDPIGYEVYTGTMLLLEAIKKAGTTETEAVIDTLLGLRTTSLMGQPISIRAVDQGILWPIVMGRFTTSPDYPFKILTDLTWIEADKVARPEADIREARRAAGVPEEY